MTTTPTTSTRYADALEAVIRARKAGLLPSEYKAERAELRAAEAEMRAARATAAKVTADRLAVWTR